MKTFETPKNSCGSHVEVVDLGIDHISIRTMCPMFDKADGAGSISNTRITLSQEMAQALIAELTRLFPERRKGDRRGK